MAQKNASVSKPTVAGRQTAVAPPPRAFAAAVPVVRSAHSLQQRLGNRGTQALAMQVVARSSAPGDPTASSVAISEFSLSQPRDAHEREAENVADRIVRMAEPALAPGLREISHADPPSATPAGRRLCAACEDEHAHAMARLKDATPTTSRIHRSEAATPNAQITPSVAAGIRELQGKGIALPQAARAFFEQRFGASFGKVRVHTDTNAARTAGLINAKAFTVGRDIAFGAGQFSPDSQAGRHLLAHELTHVVQNDRASLAHAVTSTSTVQRDAADPKSDVHDDAGLRSQLDDEIATWETNAAQDEDLMLRAKASRMVLLLKGFWRIRPKLPTQPDLDNFRSDCDKRALTELGTLGVFTPAGVELVLMQYPKGFPLTWSGRVRDALSLGIDRAALLAAGLDEANKLARRSIALGPALASVGLPVPFDDLERLAGFRLRMTDAKAKDPHPVREFATEGIRYMQVKWILAFGFAWESMAYSVAEAVAEGTKVPAYSNWKDFIDNKRAILRGLPARARDRLGQTDEDVEKLKSDSVALGDAALTMGMARGVLAGFAILGSWNDVTAQFDAALKTADATIGSGGSGDHLIKAPTWAWAYKYFKGAAVATGRAMLEQAPAALAEMAFLMVLGKIPPLGVPLSIYMRLKMGIDVTEMLVELASAIDDIVKAKTVTDLQKAAARLAALLVRAAIFGAMLGIAWGIGKAVAKLKQNKAELKTKNPALSEEDASKKAMAQLSKEERAALGGTKASLAKSIATKFEEFAGVCRLGSVLCDSLPVSVHKEVGPPPKTQYNVPSPKGPFNIQRAALSTATRRPEALRAEVLKDPARWPHLVEAMAKNGGKWPVDSNNKPWEVHHIKSVGMGGDSGIDNLFPLPKADHSILTSHWNRVRLAFEKRFTAPEWDAIYTKSTKDVSGADVPTSRLP